ncbi:hypothetical protein [Rhodovulum kholense]|uniref:Uncharacterized protein n=1 Tax=Rhodovulum kholense TaxID=453584 RepID=A0A8E2VHR2_9RHOB|nr:hypothetical protein [Rhodovulum kholense]PTW43924.1 hypothetical protein C8N38_12064 [Rhodovulum kholense]
MARAQKAGTIQDAIRGALDATGKKDRDIADFLGIRGSTLSYGTEENEDRPGGLGVNYLDRLCKLFPAAAAPLAQHFAGLAGGVFQPIDLGPNVASLYSHCSDIAKECGEAQAATLRAAESAKGRDCQEAEREIDEAVEALLRAKAIIRKQRGAA